jgi:hypothetical protein
MSRRDLPRCRARRRALQGLRGREQLVEVGHLAGVVTPCAADRTAALDEEGRSLGDVIHAAVLMGDPEAAHRVSVPVREELDVAEVERLAPRRLRPARVARDRERQDSCLLELRSPVTQELELVRSGRRPGEQEEEEERGRVVDELRDPGRLPWSEPDGCVRNLIAGSEHRPTLQRPAALNEGSHESEREPLPNAAGAGLRPAGGSKPQRGTMGPHQTAAGSGHTSTTLTA